MTTASSDSITRARAAWNAGRRLRCRRQRYKRFVYGRQWDDTIITSDNRSMSELELVRRLGHHPTTYNILRPTVSAVVGHFRTLRTRGPSSSTLEADCRTFEEFLISGCAIQRVDPDGDVSIVAPPRFFIDRCADLHGADTELLGQIHDMSLTDMLIRFARGDSRRAVRIKRLFETAVATADEPPLSILDGATPVTGSSVNDHLDFFRPADRSLCRVVEIWSRECPEPQRGVREWTPSIIWRCRFMLPSGEIIDESTADIHPYAFRFYPLIDGEVHPYVEDLIDQQKHVNRLLTLHDRIVSTAAKGVLLFPDNQLSRSMSIEEAIDNWASPNGVVLYTPKPGLPGPQQVVSAPGDIGLEGLLGIHMQMLREVSGVSGAMRGQDAAGHMTASLYQSQQQGSATALADVIGVFKDFIACRDRLAVTLRRGISGCTPQARTER